MGLPRPSTAIFLPLRLLLLLLLLPVCWASSHASLVLTVDTDFVAVDVPAGTTPDSVVIRISNPTDGIYVASIVNGEFVSSDAPSYFMPGNSFADMEVSFSVAGLEPGEYSDSLIINQLETGRKSEPWLAINFSINILEVVPPSITGISPSGDEFELIPDGIRVLEGASISLIASATGTEPLVYEWQFTSDLMFDFVPVEPGNGVFGIDSSSISFDGITLDRSGYYRCVVSNGVEFDESAPFLIEVEPLDPPTPPTITGLFYEAPDVQLIADGISIQEGLPVLLRVAVTGTEPFAYQWEFTADLGFDFTPVMPGEGVFGIDSFSLAFDAMELDRAGYYRCVVSNDLGFTESEPFLIQVEPFNPPTAPEIISFS
jgi:hypothetical protein